MSLPIKAFSAVLILGCAGLFVLKKPDGTPILSMQDFLPDISSLALDAKKLIRDAKELTSSIGNSPDGNSEDGAEQNAQAESGIYRWKDSNGQWQFSDTPPTNQSAEAINVSGNLNKDLVATYEPPKELAIENDTANSNTGSTASLVPMTISPDEVSKLMKDVNNMQQLMDDRGEQLKQY
jgi:hypothetical protein